MAVDQVQQWLPDPAGKHQFRLHTDGRPTEWVSDGGSMTVDRLEPSGVEHGAVAVGSVQAGATPGGSASNWQPPTTVERAPATAPVQVRPAGWYRNASNPSEVRYWDGTGWAADPNATDPNAAAPNAAAPSAPTGPPAPEATPAASPAASFGTPPGSAPLGSTLPGPAEPAREPARPAYDTPGRHSIGRAQPTVVTDDPLRGSLDAVHAPAVAPAVASIVAPASVSVVPPEAPVIPQPAPAAAPEASAAPEAAATPQAESEHPEPAASTTPGPFSTVPADWYPDPSDRTRLRYWDGAGWTEHVLNEAPAPRPTVAGAPLGTESGR